MPSEEATLNLVNETLKTCDELDKEGKNIALMQYLDKPFNQVVFFVVISIFLSFSSNLVEKILFHF